MDELENISSGKEKKPTDYNKILERYLTLARGGSTLHFCELFTLDGRELVEKNPSVEFASEYLEDLAGLEALIRTYRTVFRIERDNSMQKTLFTAFRKGFYGVNDASGELKCVIAYYIGKVAREKLQS